MTVKLRRPARGTGRPAYATGGGVVRVPTSQPGTGPNPEQQRARRALQNAGVDRPRPEQLAHVARAVGQDNNRGGPASPVGPAVARALQMDSSNGSASQPETPAGLSPNILAALSTAPGYARGGAVAPGLPAPMFRPQALPAVPTPGLASPHGLIGARHRQHFSAGGAALPPHILAALALRPHFDDGGQVVGFDDGGQPIYGAGAEAGAIYGASPAGADQDGGQDQPTITASLSAQALPSDSRDPSGLLQNGTDTTALNDFWAGKANAMPSPQWSNTRAGLAPNGGALDAAPDASAAPSAASAAPPAHVAAALAPVYNPMADPTVRASLHLATGGVARAGLPQSVIAALAARPFGSPFDQRRHFEDGGDAGGGASSSSSGGDTRSGGGGSDSSSSSSSSSSSAGAESSGGSSNASSGGGSNSSSASAAGGTGGGVGGIGGGGPGGDGYGGGSSSGGRSDASSGGSDRSSAPTSAAPSGSQSDAATGAANGSNAGLGAAPSGSSATSGPVGSISGSVGAPAAGGFSGAGAPATGGFGGFGATPSAISNPAGLSGATPTASSLSGQTATQSAAAEARAGGDPGEDGTTSAGAGVTTTGAFGSFGPAPSSPYGSVANAQQQFGGTQASDLAGSSLSPMGQQLGQIGLGAGVPSAMAANPNGFASPGAYGLSSVADGYTPGMDNFSTTGGVQASLLGEHGYTGLGDSDEAPNTSYSTIAGTMPASVVNAIYGGLSEPPSMQTDLADLSKSFTPDYSGTAFGPDGKLSVPGNTLTGSTPTAGLGAIPTGAPSDSGAPVAGLGTTPALTIHGPMTEAAYGGYDAPGAVTPFGAISDKQVSDARQNIAKGIGTAADQATVSGYAAQQASPVGRTVGLAGLGAQPTSNTSGLNADGDPTSVNGTSALTIHGTLSPSGQMMSDGVTQNTYNGQPTAAALGPAGVDMRNIARGIQISNMAGLNAFSGDLDQSVAQAARNVTDFSDAPPASVASDPASQPEQPPSLTVSGIPGVPNDAYSIGMHRIEGGVLDGKVDPNNPTHYGPAQFTQATFSGVARNHPGLGISPNMSMFSATAEQYSAITSALTQDDAAALQNAGLPATPANLYMMHNLGAPVALAALRAGPDATLAQAGIPGAYVKSNPSIYGGLQTIGQVQARVAGMLEKGAAGASTTTPSGIPSSVQEAVQASPANYSPGAASGMDTTDTHATTTNPGISPPSTWSPGQPSAPTTQTISTPAPYGVTTGTAATLGNFGMAATPANALAGDTLGYGVASQIMNGVPSDPVESAGVSDAAMAANPSFFAGAKTIGDVQANIAKAAETAGTTTSTVTTPGAPASPDALPGYSYSPGAASGLDSLGVPGASPYGISSPSVYGVPSTAPGPATAPSAPATGTPNTATGQPDTSVPSHLSVPTGVTNTLAGLGLGALGPIGAGLAGVNTVSGLLGGPTIGSMLNGALSNSGAGVASSPGGQGDNSSQPGASYPTLPAPYGPSTGSDEGSAASADGSTSSGVSPFDPHAAAMAAYDAAMASRPPSAASAGAYDGTARPLVIHRGRSGYTPAPVYNPMQDPSVLRALGME